MSLIVLGTVALDTLKTPYGRRQEILGGSAVHFSLAARLFTKVHLSAVVGEDFPDRHLRFLEQKGIVLDSLLTEQGGTFRWEGKYEGDLNCALTLKTQLGVLAAFKPKITERQRHIKHVFLANVDPFAQKKMLDKMHSPSLVGVDSMNYWINNARPALLKLLKRVDIYVANDQEARALSGETNLIKAAKYLRWQGPKMVVIKKGEHGVLFYSDKFIFSISAFPTEHVVDPTGAGDTFAGAFMGYLANKKKVNRENIKKAVLYGSIAASFNVEGFGPERSSKMTLIELNRRLKQFRNYVSF